MRSIGGRLKRASPGSDCSQPPIRWPRCSARELMRHAEYRCHREIFRVAHQPGRGPRWNTASTGPNGSHADPPPLRQFSAEMQVTETPARCLCRVLIGWPTTRSKWRYETITRQHRLFSDKKSFALFHKQVPAQVSKRSSRAGAIPRCTQQPAIDRTPVFSEDTTSGCASGFLFWATRRRSYNTCPAEGVNNGHTLRWALKRKQEKGD